MRLRQVALVAAELEPVRRQFFQLLGLNSDFADHGVAEFGLENSVMAIGDSFLEIVAPKQPGTTAERLLERRGGDGGYMVICQVDDIVPYREHTDALKVRKVWDADLPDAKAFHMHPRDIGGAIVSLDEMIPPESWRWGGPDWQTRPARHVGVISGTTLQADDPAAMAARWGEIFKVAATGNRLNLANDTYIEFVPVKDGRGEGVAGVSFSGCDLPALQEAATAMGLAWQENSVQLGGVQLRFTA
ncbi:MAG: VOC family protein [Pseudomonadales bacterium]